MQPQESAAQRAGAPLPPRTVYYAPVGDSPTDEPPAQSFTTVAQGYALDFVDVDVRALIGAVLGDILRLGYVIAPQVQGKVTLRTGQPVSREAVLPALETALAQLSIVLLPQGETFVVTTGEQASQRVRSTSFVEPGQRHAPGFAIDIVTLRYVQPREMVKVLEAVVPKGTVVSANDQYGFLAIAGNSVDRASVLQTIASYDIDSLRHANFALMRVDNVNASRLVAEAKSIFQGNLELADRRLRLVPLDRIQSVLAIASSRADLELIETWVRRLDVTPRSSERGLHVYQVQSSNAKQLAAALQQLWASEPAAAVPTTKSGERADPLTAISAPTRDSPSRVVANEDNNSILFYGSSAEFQLLRETLLRLDVEPRQVMIEAILAEVSLGDDLRYGVQWFFDSQRSSSTLSNSDSGAVTSQFPGFSYVFSRGVDARVVLNALESRTNVRVLSAPKLAVLNNQKASLQIGDEVPIRTQVSQATSTPGAPVISTIQMRDTGVILEVTPRISDNGNVILEVSQEVSDVATTTTSGIDSPTIQRRKIKSTLATRDGATIVMGGLIRETASRGSSGVPVLKDVPVLGKLFSVDSDTGRRTELIVLLVPHVIRDASEARAVTEALINAARSAAEIASHATPALQQRPK